MNNKIRQKENMKKLKKQPSYHDTDGMQDNIRAKIIADQILRGKR
jgi:hypothetical protein